MPRIRSIKPEFWTSGQVLECSTNARLLFIGLWNFCDDAGRHPLRLRQIKAEVFPADDFVEKDIQGMIDELSENGLITTYHVDAKGYFQVNGWHHQRIDKPQDPKYPGPIQEHYENVPRTIPPDRIGEDGIGEDKKEPNGSSGEQNSPAAEVVFSIPLTKGKFHHVTADDLAHYRKTYPAVDVEQSFRNMLEWLELNQKKRSGTATGAKRRITSWLSRDQDKAGRSQPGTASPVSAEREAQKREFERQMRGAV